MTSAPGTGGKVLVLEDDPGIRRLERNALERAGYRVALAETSAEAREALAKGDIDLLLLDYQLGEGDNGLEFYRQLQAERKDVPAILITGFGDEARILEAMRSGVRDFIPKTPNFVELVALTVERVLTQVQKERRLQEAESASRAKDDFLAALSHELRTPLTPVLALVSELRLDERLPLQVREDLVTIHRNIQLEARLIDDLLDLTRITRGKLELRLEALNLRPIIDHAIKTTRDAETASQQLTWRFVLPDESLPVRADAARITQVLWNLLKNSLKFTPAHGAISLTARIEHEPAPMVVVEVTDTGIGIDPQLLPRIFGAFEQGDRAITRRFGGLGLGLAISWAIVDSHGGSLTAASPGVGLGATFTVKLPLCPVEPKPAPQAGVSTELSAPAGASLAKLLLVEDHCDTAAIMARMLRRAGYGVICATGVTDALEKMERLSLDGENSDGQRVRLVVSDLGLPDGSGVDLMLDLRKRYDILGIALSGYGMEEDVRRSREAGFSRHLTKPVDFDRLLSAIREVLATT